MPGKINFFCYQSNNGVCFHVESSDVLSSEWRINEIPTEEIKDSFLGNDNNNNNNNNNNCIVALHFGYGNEDKEEEVNNKVADDSLGDNFCWTGSLIIIILLSTTAP